LTETTSGNLNNGWAFKAQIDKDPAGNWVVTGLTITPTNERAKNIGLTTSVLRSIKINELLDYEIEDMDWIEQNLWFSHPDWEKERKEWLNSIKGQWISPGIKSHPEWMYARIAAFYLLARREDSSKPINLLAKWLEVDVKVASRRVDKARQLGLLTRPFSAKHGAPAGKSSGNLTSKCEEILGWKTTKNKKGK
jgi:hypothetical protein